MNIFDSSVKTEFLKNLDPKNRLQFASVDRGFREAAKYADEEFVEQIKADEAAMDAAQNEDGGEA